MPKKKQKWEKKMLVENEISDEKWNKNWKSNNSQVKLAEFIKYFQIKQTQWTPTLKLKMPNNKENTKF